MTWPNDADGDVFRRLAEHQFDFSKPHTVDYNVDFERWPPAPAALNHLDSTFGPIVIFDPDADGPGYVQFQVRGPVTYEAVTRMQRQATVAMAPYGGICDSWGVLQEPI